MITFKTKKHTFIIKNIKFHHIIKRNGSGVGFNRKNAIDKVVERFVKIFQNANAKAAAIKTARDKNNITLSSVSRPHPPISTQPRLPLLDQTQRNTPEYHRALMQRFPPVNRPRIFDHPSFNSLLLDIASFMRQYYNTAYSNLDTLIAAFRHIQFDPFQVHSRMYNYFMTLFHRLNHLLYGQNTLENSTSSHTTTNTTSTTSTTTTTSSTSYGTSSFDFDPENIINSTSSTSSSTINSTDTRITTDMLKKALDLYKPDNFDKLTQKEKNMINPLFNPTTPDDTVIIEGLLASEVTDLQVVVEGIRRGLLKINDNSTQTSFSVEHGGSIIVGKNNVEVKATPLFQGYVKMVKKPVVVEEKDPENEDGNFCIGVVPVDDSKVLLPSSKHKHALLMLSHDKKTYRVYGYFTSKKSDNIFISKKQFKPYQNEQASGTASINKKDQYLAELKNTEIIPAEKVIILAYGEEYLKTVENKQQLSALKDKLDAKPFIEFDVEGHTKQDLINIMIAFDAIIKTKSKHPKSDDYELIHKNKNKVEDDNNDKL